VATARRRHRQARRLDHRRPPRPAPHPARFGAQAGRPAVNLQLSPKGRARIFKGLHGVRGRAGLLLAFEQLTHLQVAGQGVTGQK
jgi:hypothetical protein